MAQLVIDIPDNVLARVVEALCDGAEDRTNAKAKAEVVSFIKEKVAAYEANKAAREAFKTATENVENNVNLS